MVVQTVRLKRAEDLPHAHLEEVSSQIPLDAPVMRHVRTGRDGGGPRDSGTGQTGPFLEGRQPSSDVRKLPQPEARDGGLKTAAQNAANAYGHRGSRNVRGSSSLTGNVDSFSDPKNGKGVPLDDRQQATFEEFKKALSERRELTLIELAKVQILACLKVEMDKLQEYINRHGPTYQVRGKSGDTYSRSRPEYTQLQEVRHKFLVLADRLEQGDDIANDGNFIAL